MSLAGTSIASHPSKEQPTGGHRVEVVPTKLTDRWDKHTRKEAEGQSQQGCQADGHKGNSNHESASPISPMVDLFIPQTPPKWY